MVLREISVPEQEKIKAMECIKDFQSAFSPTGSLFRCIKLAAKSEFWIPIERFAKYVQNAAKDV